MLSKTITLLALVFVVNIVHAQGILCGSSLDDPACSSTSAFSADNVHQVRSFASTEAPIDNLLEASWHETGLIFVTLGERLQGENPMLKYLDFYPAGGIGDGGLFSVERLAQDESFSQLAVTSDTIIVGTNTGSLLFWYLRQELLSTPPNRRGAELPVSKGEISEILTHPSGEWLLIVVDYSRVFRVDLESKSVAEIEFQAGKDQVLKALAFSDDGLLLAAAGNGSIRIWNTNSWQAWEPATLSAESIEQLLFTASDSQLIVLADKSVSRWTLSDKSLRFVQELEPYPFKRTCHISAGDISPDGSLLMITDLCSQIRAWDLAVDREIFIPQLDSANDEYSGAVIQFSPDGFYLFEGYSNLGAFGILFVNIYHEPVFW